ncbi:DUF1634 domain-containing protein [Leptolyngbya ohadii]|uniref:DUF1634 domain-containing protein n=1 Tax=Leptolyngbya ohadii TaxID=1962290 RepID=UPI000B59E2D8|nr:DUF1634 domain-containing protein [Leptolyngbya ohadii]
MPQESDAQSLSIAPQGELLRIALDHPSDLVMDLSIRCQDYPEEQAETSPDARLGTLLSRLLRYGVWIATATVLLGGILYLMRHGMEPVNYHLFRGEPDEFRSPQGVIDAVLAGRRRGIVQLGLLFLIATPILRVLVSFLFFLRQRDFIYVLITGLVMSGLLYSLLGAYF